MMKSVFKVFLVFVSHIVFRNHKNSTFLILILIQKLRVFFNLSEEDEDARLAREAQDLEYAKMIHEKDKAKLKRAKERKKLKKQHEQQQQQQFNEVQNRTESRTSGERRSGSHTPQRSFDATPNLVSFNYINLVKRQFHVIHSLIQVRKPQKEIMCEKISLISALSIGSF